MALKIPLAIAVSLAAGFAAAVWIERSPVSRAAANGSGAAPLPLPMSFDSSLPVEARIRALEQAVSDERYARQLLEDEVFRLTAELDARAGDGAPAARPEIAGDAVARSVEGESPRRARQPEDRSEVLRAAGFTPEQADWIARRESELQMAALQARYEAGQSGDMEAYWRSRGEMEDVLREELGEADYERYLEANGRSTSITVGSVIESSPAEQAGLRPGDRIVRYGGERVFSMTDLINRTMDGTAGQQVVVDILRDDLPMQVVLPRGPLGIAGGRRYDGG